MTRPARVYVERTPIYLPALPVVTRFVLYDDGTFGLQSSSAAFGYFEYRGTYAQAESIITFLFSGVTEAKGVINGDLLAIEYNLLMQHSDFYNGVYVLAR